MSAAVQAEPITRSRFGVVPMPPRRGFLLLDLWGVADRDHGNRPVAGPDGKPVIFHSFTAAAEWADDHG